jgi:hypothetical protein
MDNGCDIGLGSAQKSNQNQFPPIFIKLFEKVPILFLKTLT